MIILRYQRRWQYSLRLDYSKFSLFLFPEDVPEAVQTACVKCTPAQKHIFHIFLQALKTKLPKEYEAFNTKYDPEGKHFAALETAVASS